MSNDPNTAQVVTLMTLSSQPFFTAHMRHPGVRRRQRSGVESILVANGFVPAGAAAFP
jgi:hypothetical protein